MDPITATKLVTNIMVGLGVDRIVAGIISSNVESKKVLGKVCIFCGRIVLASVVCDVATDHVEEKIDGAVSWWKKIMSDPIVKEG